MAELTIYEQAGSVAGIGAVRKGGPSDEVDGIVPGVVAEPADAAAVARILEWASREKLSVLTRGGGTKMSWGGAPARIDVLLSTARMNAVVAHRHGDLTATVEAGASLASVNRTLAQHRQWIPLDPLWASNATIGGLVATNDSGPRRHRYGAPRDLIIGVEFARADGRLAKGGGIVVKNVAGYDLPRLLTGSFGCLGVIVNATFKLYPLTAASKTLVVEVRKASDLAGLAGKIAASHLTPTALEFNTHPLRLVVRFESIEASVERQSEAAAALIGSAGFTAQTLSGHSEEQFWLDQAGMVENGRGALVKVGVLPTKLADALSVIERHAGKHFVAAGRAGAGVFFARIDGDEAALAGVVGALRDTFAVGSGSAVVVKGPVQPRAAIDTWGPIGDGLPLMKAVKKQFDPSGVLNPGRGPGGL